MAGSVARLMSIHLHWYLPTNGDSREIVGAGDDSHLAVGPTASGMRPPTIDYLGETPARPNVSASKPCSPPPVPGGRMPGSPLRR